MSNSETEKLIAMTLEGDGDAFQRLLAPLEPGLLGFIRGRLRGRGDVDAEDVLQDLRIYLHSRLDRYNPAYPFDVFARGLARNIVKRFVFKRSDLPLPGPDDEDDPAWHELSPAELEGLPQNMRDVLGEGRFAEADATRQVSREFLEMFEIFVRYGGYPHQQLAFGFSILVWGKGKRDAPGGSKVPVTGDPDQVVDAVGPLALKPAADDMLDDVAGSMTLDPEYVSRVRVPLEVRLSLTVRDLFAKDVVSSRQFAELAEALVGRSLLREYFGKDARKSVADWTRTVKERIKKVLQDPGAAARSPLPFATPPPEPGAETRT